MRRGVHAVMRRHFSLRTEDGRDLAATWYRAPSSTGSAEEGADAPVVVIGSALAVRRSFYDRFARWLQARGFRVLTFDYRGIGGSRGALSTADRLHDWGERDLAAALAYAQAQRPGAVLFVGHSVAGQLLALAPNNHEVHAAWLVGSPTGAFRDFTPTQGAGRSGFSRRDQAFIAFAFFIGIPVATRILGRLPGRLFQASEDLPARMARDWAAWGRARGGLRARVHNAAEGFSRLRARACFVSIADDFYGPWSAVDALSTWYENARSERRHLVPDDLGLAEIGHFGFFRPERAADLWPEVAAWLTGTLIEAGLPSPLPPLVATRGPGG